MHYLMKMRTKIFMLTLYSTTCSAGKVLNNSLDNLKQVNTILECNQNNVKNLKTAVEEDNWLSSINSGLKIISDTFYNESDKCKNKLTTQKKKSRKLEADPITTTTVATAEFVSSRAPNANTTASELSDSWLDWFDPTTYNFESLDFSEHSEQIYKNMNQFLDYLLDNNFILNTIDKNLIFPVKKFGKFDGNLTESRLKTLDRINGVDSEKFDHILREHQFEDLFGENFEIEATSISSSVEKDNNEIYNYYGDAYYEY